MNEKILLFIPAYNCEKQITRVLGQIDSEVKSLISEVIVVNNRSTDHTELAVTDYCKSNQAMLPRVTLLRNDDNYVLGGSHKVAFEYAIKNEFDYVVVLHGDDQGDIHSLMPVLKSMEYQKYACCLGSRFMKGASLQGYSWLRTMANVGFNIWFSMICGRRIYDLGSGLNMYSVETLRQKYYLKFPDKLFFNDVMVLASVYYGHKILFFPITWREEDQTSNVRLFHFGLNLLKISTAFIFNRKKLMESEMREKIIQRYSYKVVASFSENNEQEGK